MVKTLLPMQEDSRGTKIPYDPWCDQKKIYSGLKRASRSDPCPTFSDTPTSPQDGGGHPSAKLIFPWIPTWLNPQRASPVTRTHPPE